MVIMSIANKMNGCRTLFTARLGLYINTHIDMLIIYSWILTKKNTQSNLIFNSIFIHDKFMKYLIVIMIMSFILKRY